MLEENGGISVIRGGRRARPDAVTLAPAPPDAHSHKPLVRYSSCWAGTRDGAATTTRAASRPIRWPGPPWVGHPVTALATFPRWRPCSSSAPDRPRVGARLAVPSAPLSRSSLRRLPCCCSSPTSSTSAPISRDGRRDRAPDRHSAPRLGAGPSPPDPWRDRVHELRAVRALPEMAHRGAAPYVIAAFLAHHADGPSVLGHRGAVLPVGPGFITTLVGILGTTRSRPTSSSGRRPGGRGGRAKGRGPRAAPRCYRARAPGRPARRHDRMCFSNLVMYFIILATASTLYRSGHRYIETSGQAAEALRPLAGDLAYLLFSLGVVGTGSSRSPSSPLRVLCGRRALRVAIGTGVHAAPRAPVLPRPLGVDPGGVLLPVVGTTRSACSSWPRSSTACSHRRSWCSSCWSAITGRSWASTPTASG